MQNTATAESQLEHGLDVDELRGLELLHGVSPESVSGLLRRCSVRTVLEGETLISAGQCNRTVYLILSGRLSVEVGGAECEPIALLASGETVGEVSTLDQQPASADVRALEETRLLTIDEPTFWSLIGASHAFALNLILKLGYRLRGSNHALSEVTRLREQFERAALFDALTGVANRRWLDQSLPRLVLRHIRSGDPLVIAMVDVDHFKPFNDQFGHQAGDRVLHQVARTLSDRLRPTDLLARYGGEEFVAIFPETDIEGAAIAAERLRRAVSSITALAPDGSELPPVTISLGLAEVEPGMTAAGLLATSDAALYRAKRGGRNRVCL